MQKKPSDRLSMSQIAEMPFVKDFVDNKLQGMLRRGAPGEVLITMPSVSV